MARELESRVRSIDGVAVVRPVQANAVFAILLRAVDAVGLGERRCFPVDVVQPRYASRQAENGRNG